jgi:hypothetical protein
MWSEKIPIVFLEQKENVKTSSKTFGSMHVSTSFVSSTKVGHHLLVLQNSTRCVEGSYSNLGRIFLFFPLKYNNKPNLTNL